MQEQTPQTGNPSPDSVEPTESEAAIQARVEALADSDGTAEKPFEPIVPTGTGEKIAAAGAALHELASIEIEPERPCSVEITHNAKGEVSFKVKAYAEELVDAATKARVVYARMYEWIKDGSPAP